MKVDSHWAEMMAANDVWLIYSTLLDVSILPMVVVVSVWAGVSSQYETASGTVTSLYSNNVKFLQKLTIIQYASVILLFRK